MKFGWGSDMSQFTGVLNPTQRERLKSLILSFKEEGVEDSYGVKYELDDIVELIDYETEKEEREQKIELALSKGETTIPKERWSVHETHCCGIHGCKYGDRDCPVEIGLTTGIVCEDCNNYNEQGKYISYEDYNNLIWD